MCSLEYWPIKRKEMERTLYEWIRFLRTSCSWFALALQHSIYYVSGISIFRLSIWCYADIVAKHHILGHELLILYTIILLSVQILHNWLMLHQSREQLMETGSHAEYVYPKRSHVNWIDIFQWAFLKQVQLIDQSWTSDSGYYSETVLLFGEHILRNF